MSSRVLLPACLSAGLLVVSFFPLNWGVFGWIALVPWLMLVPAVSPRRRSWNIYLAGWLGSLLFLVPALQWLRVAHPMMHFTWAGLSLYCSLYFVLSLWLMRRFVARGVPLPVVVPIVWLATEFLRGSIGGGFAWYTLGQTQHDFLPIIQIADVVGMWGVSGLVAAVNGLIAAWLLQSDRVRRWLRIPETPRTPTPFTAPATLRRATIAIVGCWLATFGYGLMQLNHPEFPMGPRVALIQGNLEQGVRIARNANDPDAARNAIREMSNHHVELANQAASAPNPPDVIIWPETSYPLPWVRLPRERPADVAEDLWDDLSYTRNYVRERFIEMGKGWGTHALIGLNGKTLSPTDPKKTLRYNTALLINPEGEPTAYYHKMHRVPFGEYIPFKDSLPFLKWFSPYDYDYGIEAGTEWTQFELPSKGQIYRFGVVICYEDSDPTLARQYNSRVPVDFLVNISNDGWFKGSEEHEQHLAVARFRAVETRRALVRAVNMGVSAVIDGDGRIVALPGDSWATSKAIPAALVADVPIDDRVSFYGQFGDWLPLLCLTAVLAALLLVRDQPQWPGENRPTAATPPSAAKSGVTG
ncbi:apolipoprotein N-acyltransferase [Tuwongella immobilis]|uniref:Apolipoprotein N-acyltransferase n=1 Tax=Tuwongella immobilis TaxID=692036 RepID=A0A6C2YI58_9BACT|nr:apolipoprotein N-acyltransferase [Tuwongella immobilis]VIP01096.1 apolipoprotein n-acyltransferase : Apolipoprotein N-acyltransferase OS=Planctomyces maris DSM 8797 GN=lnt PE=3 SV=1: CN_hydrolase [Tuwongella immobilis]VTR97617.1 apolipoprotein n-acyltransferase : Apolipoprotein N-acyltransferase OS=Planctomyces maris DSM 8797 GN=lnt PE=3 SV=1: CN_hydrolase [Tuwongella immobilis]